MKLLLLNVFFILSIFLGIVSSVWTETETETDSNYYESNNDYQYQHYHLIGGGLFSLIMMLLLLRCCLYCCCRGKSNTQPILMIRPGTPIDNGIIQNRQERSSSKMNLITNDEDPPKYEECDPSIINHFERPINPAPAKYISLGVGVV